MALTLTFTQVFPKPAAAIMAPLEVGAKARSEQITLGATTLASSASAAADENVLDVYAAEACWIQIGAAPVAAVAGATCRFVAAGERLQFFVEPGQKLAGILA